MDIVIVSWITYRAGGFNCVTIVVAVAGNGTATPAVAEVINASVFSKCSGSETQKSGNAEEHTEVYLLMVGLGEVKIATLFG